MRGPDVLDKRKRVIDGRYTPKASQQVQEGGLWDSRVTAKVRAFPAIDPLTGKRYYDRFSFRSVEAATAARRTARR